MSSKILHEIRSVLTPKHNMSVISDEQLYPLKPLFSLRTLRELLVTLPEEKHARILSEMTDENVVIYNNHVFLRDGHVNFNDRIARIFTAYKENLQNSMRKHGDLMEIYDQLTPAQLSHLAQRGIVIGMRQKYESSRRMLCASYYMDTYIVSYNENDYQFPPAIIIVPIDSNLKLHEVEVLSLSGRYYRHMFAYGERPNIGQKICLGGYYNDEEQKKQYNQMSLPQKISFMITKSEQILKSGYFGRNLTPVNHIDNYDDYIIS